MTTQKYGWIPQPPDHRDYQFAASRDVLQALPSSVDLALPALPAPFEPAFDQGKLGSCSANAACGDIVFAAYKQDGLSACPMPSRLFVYYATRMLMGTTNQDSGADNRSLMKALAKYGWCDESSWPYNINNYAVMPPQSCFDQGAQRLAKEYLAVPQNLDQMKGCLAGGDPFIFGFTVCSSFESQQAVSTGEVPMPSRSEKILGGHDVLIVGFDDVTQRFKFRNSWGASYGKRGYGTIPYAYVINPNLSQDFWTVRHSYLPAPTPTPVPDPSGTWAYRLAVDKATGDATISRL